MTLNEYQKLAKRTMKEHPGGFPMDILHMVIGLHSEYNELTDAIKSQDSIMMYEEIGDQFWYLSNYCYLRKTRLADLDVSSSEYYTKPIYYLTSLLQDLVKREIIYNKELDIQAEIDILQGIFFKLKSMSYPKPVPLVLEANIVKLMIRYPEAYSDTNAASRDLKAERAVLVEKLS